MNYKLVSLVALVLAACWIGSDSKHCHTLLGYCETLLCSSWCAAAGALVRNCYERLDSPFMRYVSSRVAYIAVSTRATMECAAVLSLPLADKLSDLVTAYGKYVRDHLSCSEL